MVVSFFDSKGGFLYFVEGDPDHVIGPSIKETELSFAEGRFNEGFWLDGEEVRLRRPCTAILDGLTLLNVPKGAEIKINDSIYPCEEGGDVELEFDQVGVYSIVVSCFPYLDGEFKVENKA